MKYKNKETGLMEDLKFIKKEFLELLGNSNEFNKYKDDFNKFLDDYYMKVDK